MIGEGYLLIQDYQVLMLGEGTFDVLDIEPIEMLGVGEMYVGSTANYINAELPAMDCVFRETNNNTGDIYATLPEMTADLVGGLYVPPAIQYLYAVLPPLTASIFVETSSAVSINATLPEFICKVADHDYGEIDTTIPEMVSFLQEDPTPDTAQIVSIVYLLDGAVGQVEYLVTIDSYGQITTTLSGTKEYIAELISTLNASGTCSILGTFTLSLLSTANTEAFVSGIVGDGPQLDPSSRVWVVNIDTNATGQYDNYSYLSFYTHEGINYGIAEDGIYELTGDTDNGLPINALIDFGRTDFDSDYKKRISAAELGVKSAEKLLLKADADSQINTFEARKSSAVMTKQGINMGSALSGYYWDFTLMNQNGGDFDLESILFEIIQLNRRL